MADPANNDVPLAPTDEANFITPTGLKPKKVPMEWYRGLKSKITMQLRNVEKFCTEFDQAEAVVRSQEEKTNIYTPLKKVEDALIKWESYLEQHAAHEQWQQSKQPNYVDEDLGKQTEDFQKQDEKYSEWVIKLNRLCSDFNRAQNESRRQRERSQNQAQAAAANHYAVHHNQPQVVVVRDDDATRMNDGFRPDKLSDNAGVLQFLNWKRDIKSYFTINAMDRKPKDVQISALYACLDDRLKRFLDVNFAALPDVDIVSEEANSYLQALTNHFNAKHPLPVRVFNFFNERQRPNETPGEFAQRCEGLAITANVDEMTYDELVKYKIVTGLVHSDDLRARLLKKLTNRDFTSIQVKKEIAEHQATEKVSQTYQYL